MVSFSCAPGSNHIAIPPSASLLFQHLEHQTTCAVLLAIPCFSSVYKSVLVAARFLHDLEHRDASLCFNCKAFLLEDPPNSLLCQVERRIGCHFNPILNYIFRIV